MMHRCIVTPLVLSREILDLWPAMPVFPLQLSKARQPVKIDMRLADCIGLGTFTYTVIAVLPCVYSRSDDAWCQ